MLVTAQAMQRMILMQAVGLATRTHDVESLAVSGCKAACYSCAAVHLECQCHPGREPKQALQQYS